MNRIAHQNNLKSREELIVQLKKEGTDLNAIRENFIDNMLAQQYLNSLVQPKLTEPSRADMEAYYDTHLDEWKQQAGAVWRHIEIKKTANDAADRQKVEQIHARLVAGTDFAETARKMSQGPTAAAGGIWSRTSKGSYAEPAVDEAIFSLPVGEISDVIVGAKSYHVVRVEERSNGEPKSFVDVQEQCRERLRMEQMQKLRKDLVQRLQESHHVSTIYDDEDESVRLAQPETDEKTR
jgi:parvulin-like peptidyl-prolyl isomerase